jgi:hypothetical protein
VQELTDVKVIAEVDAAVGVVADLQGRGPYGLPLLLLSCTAGATLVAPDRGGEVVVLVVGWAAATSKEDSGQGVTVAGPCGMRCRQSERRVGEPGRLAATGWESRLASRESSRVDGW